MLKPVFTEKSLKEAKLGKYTFRVPSNMNKKPVAAKISDLFDVTVTDVKTVKKGPEKGRNARGRNFSFISIKQAIVTLKSGDKISVFEEGKK